MTRWVEAIATRSVDAKTVASFVLKNLVCRFGAPSTILTDNGSGFASNLMRELMSIIETRYIQSAPYHSKGNGVVESANRTIQDKLALITDKEEDWGEAFPMSIFSINITRHRGTGYTPFEMVFGKQPRLPFDPVNNMTKEDAYTETLARHLELIRRDARKDDTEYHLRVKEGYDKGRVDVKFNVGEKVLVFFPPRGTADYKLSDRFFGPYEVTKVLENDKYLLKLLDLTVKKKRIVTCRQT